MAAVVNEYIKRAHECQKGQAKGRKYISNYLCKLFRATGQQDMIQMENAAIFKVAIPENYIGIQNLTLDNNILRSLPESIENLSMLRILSVKGNKLCKLPASMARMKNLRELNLAENVFTEFPKEILALQLQILDISNNKIEIIPKGLSKNSFLCSLNARSNLLNFLPCDLLRAVSLRFIDFDNNPFTLPKGSTINGVDRTLSKYILENERFVKSEIFSTLPLITQSQVTKRTKCDLCDAMIPQNNVTIYKRRKGGRIYPFGFNECSRHSKDENERVVAYFNVTNAR